MSVVQSRLSARAQIVADLKQAHAIWAGRTTMAASDFVVLPLYETGATEASTPAS